jgi:Spy/CpxP family protein refolding chaperone
VLAQLKNKDEHRETTSHHMKKDHLSYSIGTPKQKEDFDYGSIAKIGFRNIV